MSCEKRGKVWRVSYRHNGVIYKETFDTEKQARARDAIVKAEKESGTFSPPHALIDPEKNPRGYGKGITVRELMKRFVEEYGPTEWKPNVLAQNRNRIEHYINPFLGDELLVDLSVQRIERYYRDLLKTPSVDDPDESVGKSVIEKIHTMLCTAYKQAQRWGYVPRDEKTVVSLAHRPKYKSDERVIWTPQQYRTALDFCEHHGLKLWLLLSASCSARIGELLGLQWDCVEFNDDGTASITFRQQLQRMDREGMANSEKFEVYFSFPSGRDSKTVLALCGMKDKNGVAAPPRTVYVGTQIAAALKAEKQRQKTLKIVHGRHYEDYNIVIAQDMGRPFEEHEIRKKLKKLCEDASVPVVVPHAMRHLSVTLKLLISGDVKAVQADSGHKDAGMVLNRYSHAMDAERKKMAMELDGMLYCPSQA